MSNGHIQVTEYGPIVVKKGPYEHTMTTMISLDRVNTEVRICENFNFERNFKDRYKIDRYYTLQIFCQTVYCAKS